ncbi:hypothetical protein [Ammoniphilus sp. CFH 90114]|nr:hypothetical protein [Ammoniphilus sp. CFH 90114]
MNLLQRWKYNWHCFWYCFNEQLLKDCEDYQEKVIIHNKIIYHRNKMFWV